MIIDYLTKYEEEVVDVFEHASKLNHSFLGHDWICNEIDLLRDVYLHEAVTYIYVENSRVVGFISVIEDEIGGLFVAPSSHRKGIGTQLIEYASSIHPIRRVEVFEKNVRARSFYEKVGFQEATSRVHPSGERLLQMCIRSN